jgi:hypothetical protein
MLNFESEGILHRISVLLPHDGLWGQAVALAQEVYKEHYGAIIQPLPDRFVVVSRNNHQCKGGWELISCAGMTSAGGGQLFSECYLDRAIEQQIEHQFGFALERSKIAEVSSLASTGRAAGAELVRALAIITWLYGFEAVICTATAPLRKIFERQGVPFNPIAEASASRLPPKDALMWGAYYQTNPQTGLVRVNNIGHMFNRLCGRYQLENSAADYVKPLVEVAA